jgi:toxin HigB-1
MYEVESNFLEKFKESIEIFKVNPFDSRLKTHKLSGNLKELYSFSLDYNYRVIFSFFESDRVIFEDIGTHEQVY